MKISERGKEFIKRFEGLRLQAYKCAGGKLTIGYGHTYGVSEGQQITRQQADTFLDEDLSIVEAAVNEYVTSTLEQNQFDALVSFTFNVGSGNLRRSTLLRIVNNAPNAFLAIRHEFMKWCYAGDVKLNGLILRRSAEAELYEGIYVE